MDTKKLRQKILDLAIRGKLVPQDPNDEPASVLLERIKAEKERLIKEGKIKKSKKSAKTSDTPHYQNVPFEIPDNWVSVPVSELFYLNPKSEIADNIHIGFIPMACVDDGFSGNHYFEKRIWKEVKKGYCHFQNGDIGIAKISPCFENLKSTIFQGLPNNCGAGTTELVILRPINIYAKFYLYLFKSQWYIDEGTKYFKGVVGQQRVHKGIFTDLHIPLPPLVEQQRIVTEIEKWFALIDQIEQGKVNLQTTIKQTKSKILDLAIHGKLVPQDPNDEPSIELLQRINPDFTPCDNGHYAQLPDGWCAVALKDLCENINGLWKGKKEPFVNVGVIRNANFTKDFKLDYSNIEYIDVEQRTFAKRHLENGDLIVEKSGGSDNNPVGRTILYEGKSGVFSFSNFTMVLRIRYNDTVLSKYLYYCILAKYQTGAMRLMQTQTTGLHNLILNKFLLMSICLPPLYEQRRIIDQIETFFTTLNLIMESL
ncbi:restriction endonuclease subunit S [Bacteroides xylanisolvens]|uniref:restriction endonuclease subunit S n=2 Tax=Bacteroides TaxID=816 RepID=UPI0022E5CA0E|nr:restriction endonuclease subunit S [Bacteroides xylanisolvens]